MRKVFLLAIGVYLRLLLAFAERNLTFADGNYSVQWSLKGADTIQFEIEAATKGWVGIGFNEAGKGTMKGGDFAIGWIEEDGEKAYITDRYGTGNTFAPRDENSSDVKLVKAVRQSNTTRITFTRLLNTCDEQDFVINKTELELLWAFGDDNVPKYEDGTTVHKKRGHKTVQLIDENEKIDLVKCSVSSVFMSTFLLFVTVFYWVEKLM